MSVKCKKGRNPAAVDNWLDSISLYRKNVAYDETCLFRAVSEQLFQCQMYHERVRRECVEYGRKHYYKFWNFLESRQEWHQHLDLLEKHMVVCGNIEIQIISCNYDCDVIVYDAANQRIVNVTNRHMKKFLMLCLLNDDHYDVVHKREHIQNSGFCQSIVYNILYEKVFQIPNVQDIVYGMLYEKEFVAAPFIEHNNNKLEPQIEEPKDKNIETVSSVGNIAPFPFKVAKALDPTIYRNIEYDSWTEVRREMRLGEWYYGDDNLILGTRCVLNVGDETFECYIQEIIKNANKCVVYVTKLAEKRTVNYADLSPENDAKPWPLPYRFSKNLVITASQSLFPEKMLKVPKKRKDKRRTKSNSETQVVQPTETFEQDIEAFVGVPLQMQNNCCDQACAQPDSTPEQREVSLSQHNLLVTPEISSPMPKFSWETPWNNMGPPEKIVWSHPPGPPPNMVNYNMKPMIASAPVTPDVVPYHDSHYPFVYNYYVENYNPWNGTNEYNNNNVQNGEYPVESQGCIENNEPQQVEPQNPVYPNGVKERQPLCMSLPPPNQQVEVYSPVVPIAPGTPVMYAHAQEMTEMMLPGAPVQVYTPPIDVQYVAPGPFIYPPTPPTAWYPTGINSQGFIFPAPFNQNN